MDCSRNASFPGEFIHPVCEKQMLRFQIGRSTKKRIASIYRLIICRLLHVIIIGKRAFSLIVMSFFASLFI